MGISRGETQESIMASIPHLHISIPSEATQYPLHPSSMPEDHLADQVLEETMVLASKKLRKRFPELFPMQALFKQVMAAKLDFPTKRSLLEQLIQAAGTPPQDAEVDKATREAMAVSAKSLTSDSSPKDLIMALVPAVEQASSFHGLTMKWAVAARLLRWSEPPPALPAVKAVYVEELVAALKRLGESLLSTEGADAALVAAIDRLEDGGDDDDSAASVTTSKRALKQHLVAARKRLKGGSLMDEAFKEVVMAALAYAGEYDQQARKLENMLDAVFAAASDGSKAVAMALGKLVHSSKPPPLELLSEVLTSMKQLELCTGGDRHDLHSASNPTEVEKFALVVLPTDTAPSNPDNNSKELMVADMVLKEALSIAAKNLEMGTRSLFPTDALVKSTQKLDLHHRMKWAILERIVNTGRTSPEETVVDKALAEVVAGVIEEACVTGEWEGLDVVGALVDAIIESLEEPPVKYALIERLILACKPAQDEFSRNKVLRDGFKVAVDQLQCLNTDQTSPLQALSDAISRLPVDDSLQMILVRPLCGAYDDAKAAGQEEGKVEGEGKVKVEEEEVVDAGYLLDQSTIDRLIAAKQKFRITSFGTAATSKFALQRPSQKK